MTKEEAIKRLEDMRKSAVVVLDSGFGSHPGESDIVYRKRKELAEFCLAALEEFEDKSEQQSMTNADRIRAMSDVELGNFLCATTGCGSCKWRKIEGCTLYEWLKRPAEVDYD